MSRRERIVVYVGEDTAAALRALAAESRAPGAAWTRMAIETLLRYVEEARADLGRLPTLDEVQARMVRP